MDHVSRFEAITVSQFAPNDGGTTVGEKTITHSFVDQDFRVEVEIARRFDCKLRKEVLWVLVDAAKPVHVAYAPYAIDGTDPLLIGNRQRQREGHGIARDEPRRHRTIHASIPSIDDGLEYAEREYGDDQSRNRQRCAQPVAQGIACHKLKPLAHA